MHPSRQHQAFQPAMHILFSMQMQKPPASSALSAPRQRTARSSSRGALQVRGDEPRCDNATYMTYMTIYDDARLKAAPVPMMAMVDGRSHAILIF